MPTEAPCSPVPLAALAPPPLAPTVVRLAPPEVLAPLPSGGGGYRDNRGPIQDVRPPRAPPWLYQPRHHAFQ
jgi:hypothetical protein